MSLSSTLYRAARLSRDLKAARRGPVALGKRRVRAGAYRYVNSSLARLLRQMGLG